MTLIYIVFSFLGWAHAGIDFPESMGKTDRREATRILAFGTSNKLLTDPYPLGGFTGLEVSISYESVPIEDISRLGAETEDQSTLVYPKITIGKGLYNNLDAFVHLVPPNDSANISQYGGLLKWGFYQATFLPASFSLSVFGNDTNIKNLFFSSSGGFNLTTGITLSNISVYFGGGNIYTSARFAGGASNITSSGNQEDENIDSFYHFFGGTLQIEPVFVAVEMTQYSQSVISGKLGVRF